MIPTFTPPKPFQSFSPIVPVAAPQEPVQKEKPAEAQLPRIVQYGADTSGCGLYRLGWVNHLLNYQGKAMVCDSTVMVTDPRFYHNVKSIRLQRQALNAQKDFVKFLKSKCVVL